MLATLTSRTNIEPVKLAVESEGCMSLTRQEARRKPANARGDNAPPKSLKLAALTILLLALSVSSPLQARERNHSAITPVKGETSRVLFSATWPQKTNDLEAKLVTSDNSQTGLLQVFEGKKLVFSCEPGALFPYSLSVLDDGNLATLWHTGGGGDAYYRLIVFTHSQGKVQKVLEAASGMAPEFVYQSEGHLMGSAFKNRNGKWQTLGGPFFLQRILITKTDWVELKKPYLSGKSERQPVSADIYTWDENTGKYKVRRNIPWNRRLQDLR